MAEEIQPTRPLPSASAYDPENDKKRPRPAKQPTDKSVEESPSSSKKRPPSSGLIDEYV